MVTWVVAASAARARVFEVIGRNRPLKECFDLVHPEERMYRRDFGTDKPGRAYDHVGGQRHAVEPPADPREKETADFAREVLGRLERERNESHFDAVYLVSPPRFLGLLRGRTSNGLKKILKGTLAKDITRMDPAAVEREIAGLLR